MGFHIQLWSVHECNVTFETNFAAAPQFEDNTIPSLCGHGRVSFSFSLQFQSGSQAHNRYTSVIWRYVCFWFGLVVVNVSAE